MPLVIAFTVSKSVLRESNLSSGNSLEDCLKTTKTATVHIAKMTDIQIQSLSLIIPSLGNTIN